MKKVIQSYWRMKPSKVPIWKQKNDDSRISLKDVQKPAPKSAIKSIRTTSANKAWMKKHNISPSKLFNKKLDEMMEEYNEDEEQNPE